MAVSLNPKTFTKGGLFQDVDIEVLDFYFTLESPEGYTVADRVFAKMQAKILSDGSEVENFWSAGKSADFVPSKDGPVEGAGYELEETGSKTTLTDSTNVSIFMQEAAKIGWPEPLLDTGRLNHFKGAVLHVVRIPVKREGLEREKKEGARADTVLVPNKIVRMPGAKKAAAGKKGAAAAPAAAAEAGEVSADVAVAAVKEILGGGAATMKALKTGLLRRFMKSPDRTAILEQGLSEETLLELGYMLDGETISKIEDVPF